MVYTKITLQIYYPISNKESTAKMILNFTKENIQKAKTELLKGKLIIFPTDTVWGIGCLADNEQAIKKIYKLKERSTTKSLLLNFPNITTIKQNAKLNKQETHLIKTFMPGALSLIVNVKDNTNISKYAIKDNTIGARIPNNPKLLTLLKQLPSPLVSTSCNKSGNREVNTAQEAEKLFGKNILILASNSITNGKASTIIDARNETIQYIREGTIPFKEIKASL